MKSIGLTFLALAIAARMPAQSGQAALNAYLVSNALAITPGPPVAWEYQSIKFADLNGDGYPDLCYSQDDGIHCALFSASSGKFGTPTVWLAATQLNKLRDFVNADTFQGFTASWSEFEPAIQYGDVDGDGKADFCIPYGNVEVQCALSTGTSFLEPWQFARLGERVTVSAGQNREYIPQPYSFDPSYWMTFRLVDLNHDGKMDMCMRMPFGLVCALSQGKVVAQSWAGPGCEYNNGSSDYSLGYPYICATTPVALASHWPTAWTYTVNGAGATAGVFSDNGVWNSDQSYWGTIQFADLNGDQLPDVCGRGPSGMMCLVNYGAYFAGSNFATPSQFTDAGGWKDPQYYSTIHLADINGDGKADICGRGTLGFYCGLSTGTAF